MANIRKTTTGNWRAQVYLGKHPATGKPVFRSKVHPTKAMATTWATKAEAERDAGTAATKAQADAADGRLTVSQYWHDTVAPWRRQHRAPATVANNLAHWEHLAPSFGSRPLTEVRRAEVKAWTTKALEGTKATKTEPAVAPLGKPTVSKCLNLLSAIYASAIDDELMDTNPATGVKVPRHVPADKGYLSREDVSAIMANVDEPYRLFLELLTETGMRFGEAAGLTPEAVLRQGRQVQVRKVWTRAGLQDVPKTPGSERVVPVPERLRARLLERTLATPAGCMIFTGAHGGGLSDSNIRQRILARACDAAGVRRITPHVLRHAYTSWLTEQGVSAFDIAGALGHSSTRMLDRYNHLAPGHGDRILGALEASRRVAGRPVDDDGDEGTTPLAAGV